MTTKTIQQKYFEWLCDIVDIRKHHYIFLAKALHKKEFYWTVQYDENRAQDGIALRNRFLEEHKIEDEESLINPCSMLEMMVALAERFEYLMPDSDSDEEELERPAQWFFEMLANIGLNKYTDEYYITDDYRNVIDNTLNIVLERSYDKDGNGGLFPLNKAEKNQKKVELWYQMNLYIMEKTFDSYILQ